MFKQDNYNTAYQDHGRSCRSEFRNRFDRFQKQFVNGNSAFSDSNKRGNHIPVNILENDDFYQVQLIAAGRRKDQFKVIITDQVLTVTSTACEEDADLKFIHREYNCGAFERAFQLQDSVQKDNVHASYEDGVLTIVLQKDKEQINSGKQVDVS